jgi:hypothetical protein
LSLFAKPSNRALDFQWFLVYNSHMDTDLCSDCRKEMELGDRPFATPVVRGSRYCASHKASRQREYNQRYYRKKKTQKALQAIATARDQSREGGMWLVYDGLGGYAVPDGYTYIPSRQAIVSNDWLPDDGREIRRRYYYDFDGPPL